MLGQHPTPRGRTIMPAQIGINQQPPYGSGKAHRITGRDEEPGKLVRDDPGDPRTISRNYR